MTNKFRLCGIFTSSIIVVALIFLNACASSIPVTITKPPVIDIDKAQSFTIFPFLVNPEGTSEDPLDLLFEGYAKFHSSYKWDRTADKELSNYLIAEISKVIQAGSNLTFLEPVTIQTMISMQEEPSIDAALAKNGKLKRPTAATAVKRPTNSQGSTNEVSAPSNEQDETDTEQTKTKKISFNFGLGNKKNQQTGDPDYNFEELWLRGAEFADIAILGKINKKLYWLEDASRVGRDSNGSDVYIPASKKTFELEYSLWVYQLSDGSVLGSADLTTEAVSYVEGKEHYQRLASDEDLLKEAVRNTLPEVSHLFNSFTVKEKRVLAKDPTKNVRLKEAASFARKKEYRAAVKICDAVFEDTELYAAAFNGAIFSELSGDIEGALLRFKTLDSLMGNEDTKKEIARLEKRLQEIKRLGISKN